ncbi:MAG: hypothetical protein WCS94_11930 [Verrucomicrobiota bacterium]
MPEIKVFCLHCGQHIQCDDSYRGIQITCPSCNHSFVVPQATRSVSSPIPPPPPVTSAPAPKTNPGQSQESQAAPKKWEGGVEVPEGWGKPPPNRLKEPKPAAVPIKSTGKQKNILVVATVAGLCIVAALIVLGQKRHQVQESTDTPDNGNSPRSSATSIASVTKPIESVRPKPLPMTSDEKMARDNILRALLDVASATQLGVTRANYSALVTKALSTLNFEKIKLTASRHANYLDCADIAIHFYAKANDAWSDYYKYDWMREEKIAWMMQYDIDELKRAGVNVNSTDFPRDPNLPTAFRVPFDDCLSLYWKAADKFIDKMKFDKTQ